MTTGLKIALLKERLGFKNYREYGDFVGLSGDWLLDITKKAAITTVDVTRLVKIAVKCKVSLDWLLIDKSNDDIIIVDHLDNNDLLVKLNDLQQFVNESDTVFFKGILLNENTTQLTSDGIKVLKQLINSRI